MSKKSQVRLKKYAAILLLSLFFSQLVLTIGVNLVLQTFHSFVYDGMLDVTLREDGLVYGDAATGPGYPAVEHKREGCDAKSLDLPFVLPMPAWSSYAPDHGYLFSAFGNIEILFMGQASHKQEMRLWGLTFVLHSAKVALAFNEARQRCSMD